MLVGAAGALPAVIALVWAMEVPQELVAVTEIVPALDPGVTVMELEVEDPLHPEGRVHE
jgi:hypothetical protein